LQHPTDADRQNNNKDNNNNNNNNNRATQYPETRIDTSHSHESTRASAEINIGMICLTQGWKMASKNLGFFKGFYKPKNLKRPNLRLLGFFYFFVQFHTQNYHM